MAIQAPPAPPALVLNAGTSSSTFAIASALTEHPSPTRIAVRAKTMDVLAGHAVLVDGRLLAGRGPVGLPGRIVALQALARHGWHTIARTRTGTGGRYRLRYLARSAGSEVLRVRFTGDSTDLASRRRLGQLSHQLDARRRQQDASLRDARHAALQRPLDPRARRRPRPICRRPRIRPHTRDQGSDTLRGHRRGVEHSLSVRWEVARA
jgi:hypothetical protein